MMRLKFNPSLSINITSTLRQFMSLVTPINLADGSVCVWYSFNPEDDWTARCACLPVADTDLSAGFVVSNNGHGATSWQHQPVTGTDAHQRSTSNVIFYLNITTDYRVYVFWGAGLVIRLNYSVGLLRSASRAASRRIGPILRINTFSRKQDARGSDVDCAWIMPSR